MKFPRRDFIGLVGVAAAWPLAARAQQPAMPMIGYLGISSPEQYTLAAFRQGLGQVGYVESQNVKIDYRFAEGHYDRLPAMAADLVDRRVDAIVASVLPSARAAKAATAAIPIVFAIANDPVKLGLVTSLNRPSGNITGVSFLADTIGAKRLELLHELLPNATVIGLLVNPSNPTTESLTKDVQAAAPTIGLQIAVLNATSEHEIDAAFATFVEKRVDGVFIGGDGFLLSRREQIVALAGRHVIPAIYDQRDFAAAGGLVSYGTNRAEAYRQVGIYAARLLKGTKPADLPVVQSTKFELVINLRIAKTLGLKVPLTLQVAADEVIE
jgi:putative ABC transport system substrate-binding protein